MTGQELIDAIKKYNLENLNIESGYLDCGGGISQVITFEVSQVKLPYPEYKDYRCDEPAYIYKSKDLTFYSDGSVVCEDYTMDTSKGY